MTIPTDKGAATPDALLPCSDEERNELCDFCIWLGEKQDDPGARRRLARIAEIFNQAPSAPPQPCAPCEDDEQFEYLCRDAERWIAGVAADGSLAGMAAQAMRSIIREARTTAGHAVEAGEPSEWPAPPEGYEAVLDDDGTDTGYRREIATGEIATFDEDGEDDEICAHCGQVIACEDCGGSGWHTEHGDDGVPCGDSPCETCNPNGDEEREAARSAERLGREDVSHPSAAPPASQVEPVALRPIAWRFVYDQSGLTLCGWSEYPADAEITEAPEGCHLELAYPPPASDISQPAVAQDRHSVANEPEWREPTIEDAENFSDAMPLTSRPNLFDVLDALNAINARIAGKPAAAGQEKAR